MSTATTQNSLADVSSKGLEADTVKEFLTFRLNEEEYGIPILNAQEIISYRKSTPIPNSPNWVAGAINIRGVVIPVIDIRDIFGMEAIEYDENSVIIITQLGGRILGYVVDAVKDVLGFTEEQMQETPTVSDRIHTRYLSGMGKMGDRLVMLLDMSELLERSLDEEDLESVEAAIEAL